MPDSCRIDVIVVNYNSGEYLARCIESLLQSDIALDIRIIDNDSSDNSIALAQERQTNVGLRTHRVNVVRHPTNLGFSAAVNAGMKDAGNKLALVLNPDCQVHPHTVGKMAAALQEDETAGIAGALVFNEDGTEQRGCRRKEPTLARSAVTALGLTRWFEGVDMNQYSLPDSAVYVDAVSGSAMMFRRSYFEEISGMDEEYFLHCEDLDVCRRMRDFGYKVLFLPNVSLFHRQGASGGASNLKVEKLKHQGMRRYYREHHTTNLLSRLAVDALVWGHYLLGAAKNIARRKPRDETTESRRVSLLPGPGVENQILVSGIHTDVGDYLRQIYTDQGKSITAVVRSTRAKKYPGVQYLNMQYFRKAPKDDLPRFMSWIHLAPIWTFKSLSKAVNGGFPQKVVTLSSTSVEAKSGSDNSYDRKVVKKLVAGEKLVQSIVQKEQSQSVILRPTMIYGGPRNRNINVLKKLVRTIRCFPYIGSLEGKRQPVHAEDVAKACVQALNNTEASGTFSIAGAEVVSYREMVGRIFDAEGVTPRYLRVPKFLATVALRLVALLPKYKDLSGKLLDRTQQDQVFSNDDASKTFSYAPRKFEP